MLNKLITIFVLIIVAFQFKLKAQNIDELYKLSSESESAYDSSNYTKSLKLINQALELNKEFNNDSIEIHLLSTASHAADYLGKYDECQKYNYILLDIYTKQNDTLGIGSALNDISIIHYYKSDFKSGLNYANRSLKLHLELKDTFGIAMCYNNIANCYSDDGDLLKGLEYYFKALKFYEILNDHEGESICFANIGDTYQELDEYEKANLNFEKGIFICLNDSLDDWYILSHYLGMTKLCLKTNLPNKSLMYCEKAFRIAEKSDYRAEMCTAYILFSEGYEAISDYENALKYHKLYTELNDSIYQDENSNIIADLNVKYNLAEKEKQLEKKSGELEKRKLISIRNNWILGIVIVFFIAVIIFSYFLYEQNKARKKANFVLNKTKNTLEHSFNDVKESIDYARKIQDAILPEIGEVKKSFPNSFVLYKPKDVVSGDFYWFDTVDNGNVSLFAVVDCTGHGVPGAFMSMMASNLLNQIILDKKIKNPTQAFEVLDEKLKYNLHQKDDSGASEDGFDLSLIVYDHDRSIVEFGGAKNNIYLISDGELIIKKASRYSIGGSVANKEFIHESFSVKKGDVLYMFTDGYADQFGGVKDKKFTYKRLRNSLIEIEKLEMRDQKIELENIFEEWKGNNEQIDDICIVGIKF